MGWMITTLVSGVEEACCRKKEVGGVFYTFSEVDDSVTKSPLNCKNSCVYTTETGGRYCFQVGDLEPVCHDNKKDGVLIMGGSVDGAPYSTDVQLLGSCGEMVSTTPLTVGTVSGAAARQGSTIFICNGQTKSATDSAKCYKRAFDGTEVSGPNLKADRYEFTMTSVGSSVDYSDHTLVVVGGRSGSFPSATVLDSVEILEPGSSTWKGASYTINPPRYGHCAVAISSNSIMLIGGYNMNTVEELNIISGTTTTYDSLPSANHFMACALFENRIIVTGGVVDRQGFYSLDYSKSTNLWVTEPSMIRGRSLHVMAVINGLVTVYSGDGDGRNWMEEYDNGSWEESPVSKSRAGSAFIVGSC